MLNPSDGSPKTLNDLIPGDLFWSHTSRTWVYIVSTITIDDHTDVTYIRIYPPEDRTISLSKFGGRPVELVFACASKI